MQINQMHYYFKMMAQSVDSFNNIDFEPYEIDHYINVGISQFVKDNYKFRQDIRQGFEVDQSKISKLSSLVIKSPEKQPVIVPTTISTGRYEVNLNTLGDDIDGESFRYLYAVQVNLNISKTNCTSKNIRLKIFKHNTRSDTLTAPSWYWGIANGIFGRSTTAFVNDSSVTSNLIINNEYSNSKLSSLYIDVNNTSNTPEFDIDSVEVTYIKYPNRVFIGGYDHIDGLSTETSDSIHCDIDDMFHEEIIELAVLLASADIENSNGINIRSNQVNNNKL